ncbi:putative TIR domain, P-loop containing nucleoside triphosphate hydrolase [Helianthus annuus]|nr:putative TIR domain, P-loop containing nucleoside triphosphate hydrolase [Helianthus annuus]
MASTSASSIQKRFKYDVFLSFRGPDTRKTFVDHLYLALHHRGITTYKDDERIEKGEVISEQLIRSIQDSRLHIIVFSKNYASSSWCLNELVKIMECHKTDEQTAYPVFYDVEPREIRKQRGAVREAFAKHVEKEAAGRWRNALNEAGSLAGWELKNILDGHEGKCIQKIIEDISPKLDFIKLSIDENLIGMEIRVKKVIASLETGSNGVLMTGIKGIGGGGKTTLARAVFDHISSQFEGISFVENVREVSNGSSSGLQKLQKQLLKDVSNEKNIDVTSVSVGKSKIKQMMGSRKVLVVLDDVDDRKQLEALAGSPNWFKPGSRIIITTRDKHLLVSCGVHVDNIHDIDLLTYEEANCLFQKCAFKREIPIQGYEELSEKVIEYAAGLPLTIKVLGASLCGRTKHDWKKVIKRLKNIPQEETLKILELSYDGLEKEYQEIFLDVACILKGELKDEAIRILKACGYHAKIGIKVLEERSLITISDTGHLGLHDRVEEMGWNIVRRVDPDEPTRHSHLWINEQIEDILQKGSGTEATKSIKLHTTQLSPDIIMRGLTKMTKLKLLYVNNGCQSDVYASPSSYNYANLPNALQCVCWRGYPLSCLPNTFQAEKLVNLDMRESSICQLWEEGERKELYKLRFLDLKYSKLRAFDLGMTLRLEMLDLRGCNDFLPDDIWRLQCLEELHLTDCRLLRDIPNSICRMKSLKYLHLPYIGIKKLPEDLGHLECLKELNIEGACIKRLPLSIFQLKGLHIVWSKGQLLRHGFRSLKEISTYTASCYVN